MNSTPILVAFVLVAACTQTTSGSERNVPPSVASNSVTSPTASTSAPSNDTTIDSTGAHKAVADGAILVDVRTPAEFAEAHVDGAKNIPVQEIRERASELPKDKLIVLYCRSGHRAGEAQKILASLGYQARNLGGMSNWGPSK